MPCETKLDEVQILKVRDIEDMADKDKWVLERVGQTTCGGQACKLLVFAFHIAMSAPHLQLQMIQSVLDQTRISKLSSKSW